jgi:hypothetical protein
MGERGFGRVAHGTHGIHGKGDERREPRKRKGAEFFYHERHEIHERRREAGAGEVARELREGTRMAERGFGRVAHGLHGIHGKGGERWEPRKRKETEFI